MEYVKCPRCGKENEIDIRNATDEEGEVYCCDNCGYLFRYTDK